MPSLQDLREKLIAIRVRLKKGRTSSPVLLGNSISAGRETGSNVPTTVSTVLRIANDGAQVILPGVAAVVAPVPIAGPPLAAAVSGLVAILQGIDRNKQNMSDLAALRSRLHRLSNHLCNAPTTSDPGEQMWRESLTSMLQETSDKLMKLDKRYIRYTLRVTQAITGCSNSINEYLLEYSLASQMQMKHELHATFMGVQSMQGIIKTTLGVVTLVDAIGSEHPILVEHCTSFQQFNKMLGVVFESHSIKAKVQKLFLETGEYDLYIDHGEEVTQLTSDNWVSPLPAGTKVVMGVVVKQRRPAVKARSHRCHFCRTRNDLRFVHNEKLVPMHCKGCKRRFQVSFTKAEVGKKQDTKSERMEIKHRKIAHGHVSEEKMQLIRNFHVKHEEERELSLLESELFRLLLAMERERLSSRRLERFEFESELEESELEWKREESLLREESFDREKLLELEREEHKEMMSRFETLESGDDENGDDDSSSHAESWNGQENEQRHHRIPR